MQCSLVVRLIFLLVVRHYVLVSHWYSALYMVTVRVERLPGCRVCILIPRYATMGRDPLEDNSIDTKFKQKVQLFPYGRQLSIALSDWTFL